MKMMFNLSNGKWCFFMVDWWYYLQSSQINILSVEFLRIFLAIWFKFQRSTHREWVYMYICVCVYQIEAISTARTHCQCRFVHLFWKNYTKSGTTLIQSIDGESVAMTLPRIVLANRISTKKYPWITFWRTNMFKRFHFTLITCNLFNQRQKFQYGDFGQIHLFRTEMMWVVDSRAKLWNTYKYDIILGRKWYDRFDIQWDQIVDLYIVLELVWH